MNATWLAILRRFGQPVRLRKDGGWTDTYAFLQPVRERGETVPGAVTELGWNDSRRWLYLGKDPLREGGLLEWNGSYFRAVSGRAVFFGGRVCYWRALMTPEREAMA